MSYISVIEKWKGIDDLCACTKVGETIMENKITLFHLKTKLHRSVIYSCITNYPKISDLR